MNGASIEDFPPQRESLRELLTKLLSHSNILMRHEIELAKRELHDEVNTFRTGAITIAAGAVICLLALMSLCTAAVIVLAFYMTLEIAALCMGIVLGIIGSIIAFFGVRQIKRLHVKPENFVH